jgi:hypothetical protein
VLRTPLRCSPSWAAIKTRPNRLQKTQPVAELKQLIADDPQLDCAAQRDRRGREQPWPQPSMTQSPLSVIPAKAGIQSQPKIIKTFAAVAIVTPSQIPFLTRRAAQPRRVLSVINCSSSAAGLAQPTLLGQVLITARLGEQHREPLKGARQRVPFSFGYFLLGKQKKVTWPPGHPRPPIYPPWAISGVSSLNN